MTKERSITYSQLMVQAILENRKWMTRRVCGPQLPEDAYQVKMWYAPDLPDNAKAKEGIYYWSKPGIIRYPKLPFGLPNDILLVREEYYQRGCWDQYGETKTGQPKWNFIPTSDYVRYADNKPAGYLLSRDKDNPTGEYWYKRLARFMPKKYSRIKLKITHIGIERLQDITEEDAIQEGIIDRGPLGFTATGIDQNHTAVQAFKYLWELLHGEGSWDQNPWVWTIKFERI